MNDLHYIQLELLKKLLFSDGLRFSELKLTDDLENNKLAFHLTKLQELNYVFKDNSLYKLTDVGKEFANQMDTDKARYQKQGKRGAIQCAVRNLKTDPEFLIYTREKHPFYGSQGYPSGKVSWGERTWETSQRELEEETGLKPATKPTLFMIEHHLVYEKNTVKLLEDKYFYFYRHIDPVGKLKPNLEGDFKWVKEKAIASFLTKPFESVERILYITSRIKDTKAALSFDEITHYADNF